MDILSCIGYIHIDSELFQESFMQKVRCPAKVVEYIVESCHVSPIEGIPLRKKVRLRNNCKTFNSYCL